MRLFVFVLITFFCYNQTNELYSIEKKTKDLSVVELEQEELKQQDLSRKEESIKKELIEQQKQAKIENKKIKKEAKKKYKQAKKQAKKAKSENEKLNQTNIKKKEKITPLKTNKKGQPTIKEIKTQEEKQKTIKQTKKQATKKQKKTIKKVEKMTFINDDIILDIIDNQITPIAYKQIRVNVKNKGVPNQCIGIVKKSINNNDTKTEPIINKQVEERKNGLKKHILKSLKANEISEELINKIHDNLEHLHFTIKKNNNFIKKTSVDFINNYQIPTRCKSGKMYKKLYKKDLQVVNDVFFVEPEAILMIWSMETNFGNFIGNTNAFNALYSACMNATTLARIDYFENNLIMLAKLVDYGYFKYDVKSSFDGGLGGCQFMPDSFYKYAVSFDGGKADIINNNKDVMASIGNYLYNVGWRQYEGVLTEITLPENFDICLTGMNTTKTIGEWKKLGVKINKNGIGERFFDNDDKIASIIITDINNEEIDFSEKRVFLVYDNFKVILGYNQNINYGITAGLTYEELSQNKK